MSAVQESYDILLIEENAKGGGSIWTAMHPQLPGCNATGRTPEQAVANLDRSRHAWLKTAQQLGEPIPEGNDSQVVNTIYLMRPGSTRNTAAEGGENLESEVTPVVIRA